MKKFLKVKAWFADKNGLVSYNVYAVLEATEKAVKVAMCHGESLRTYWCPKSCLEVVEDEYLNERVYTNVAEAKTIEEAIAMNKCTISFEELAKLNRDTYNDYR